ncbi:MAG: hypothetical protein KKA76_05955, partial [Proteobacteria bacterium]|nr:hypothetical protein [Pseudomonadota bacterium]
MRYLIVLVLSILLTCVTTLSAQGVPGEKSVSQSGFSIVSKNMANKAEDFHFQLGEILQIKASGELVKKVESEWGKTKSLTLYFDGEAIAALGSPPQQFEGGPGLLLNFTLIRDAENDANRQAWDRLFRKKHQYQMTIEPSIAIGNDLPLLVHSAQPFQFSVASNSAIWLIFLCGVATLLGTYWYLATKTTILCDAETNYYSLGKSQMAFWGLLVVLSFTGIWILTGTMERIPPQALILLGISGGTGLSAVVIGNSKKAEIQSKISEKQNKLTELQQEEQKLQAQKASYPAAFLQASQDRLVEIKSEIDSVFSAIGKLSGQVAPGQSKGFWRDICDDGSGLSFHRLQVVIWTMVLGAVFVQNVVQVISMPEFAET